MKLLLLFLLLPAFTEAQIISTIAGTGIAGYSGDGGAAISAQFLYPGGIAVDKKGNVYISDQENNHIRKIDTANVISNFAGNGPGGPGSSGYSGDGGAATAAALNNPWGITVDDHGNLYIADWGNNCIRKVDTSGIITTIAGIGGPGTAGFTGDGGPATNAKLYNPIGIIADNNGNIYFTDRSNLRIRKIDSAGIISTIAGNGMTGFSGDGGPATAAEFNAPYSICFDNSGNFYASDLGNNRIRKIDVFGNISTIAGTGMAGSSGDGGPATDAELNLPTGLTIDGCGNLYIAGEGDSRIRKINTLGIIKTIIGTGIPGSTGDGGPATAARIGETTGLAIDGMGNLFMADYSQQRIRKVTSNNSRPFFINGDSQSIVICGYVTDTINSLLAAGDTDPLQTETWTMAMAPAHGTLVVAYTTTSTGDTVSPEGLTYTPAAGYIGSDTFKVIVTDCLNLSDTTTVYVAVANCALTAPTINKEVGVLMYPNPATAELTITAADKINRIIITDLIGQVVFSNEYNSEHVRVDVANLPVGVFFIKINGSQVRKFVKE